MDNSNNDVSGNINVSILEVPQSIISNDNDNNNIVIENTKANDKVNVKNNTETQFDYKESKEFIIFKNELESLINNNLYILKECKSNKRLLDIKYANLTNKVNYIQISVIVLSTLSGFLQSTKEYFHTPDNTVSVCGISISTYISLILSVSKYYKFDETKEAIHNLREKYGNLHNKIEFRMDILGPYTNYKLWEHQDVIIKLQEWNILKKTMEEEYISLIEMKQTLTTKFESIMDSKSRNKNYIRDRELVLSNREKLFKSMEKHYDLENRIKTKNIPTDFASVIQLPDDDLNNWDDPV
jgi:deoxycytidine triphosphate deaminase